jgi:hypothetical protein
MGGAAGMNGGKVCNECNKNDIVRLFRTERELKNHMKQFHRAIYFSTLQDEHVRRGSY